MLCELVLAFSARVVYFAVSFRGLIWISRIFVGSFRKNDDEELKRTLVREYRRLVLTTKLPKKALIQSVTLSGGVAEWSMAADCKSARVCVRRFKSFSLHHGL